MTQKYDQYEIKFQSKPNGLWFSVEGLDGWKEWCKGEKTFLDRLRFSYEIILKEKTNIIHLKTPEEIFSFTKKYPLKKTGEWIKEINKLGNYDNIFKNTQFNMKLNKTLIFFENILSDYEGEKYSRYNINIIKF